MDNLQISNEIFDFIKSNHVIWFFSLIDYAEKNRPDWYAIIKLRPHQFYYFIYDQRKDN